MNKKVFVDLEKEQIPTDYLVVRTQLVHVKKGLFGLKDKQLAVAILIPDTRREAAQVFKNIQDEFGKRGVRVNG